MKLKITPTVVVIAGSSVYLGYLLLINALTKESFFILSMIVIIAILYSKDEKHIITIEEAEAIAERRVESLQRAFRIPNGHITLMNETELKSVLLTQDKEPIVSPFKWDVGVYVDHGDTRVGYIVKITKFGTILGQTKIQAVEDYHVTSSPEILEIGGRLSVDDEVDTEERDANRSSAREST